MPASGRRLTGTAPTANSKGTADEHHPHLDPRRSHRRGSCRDARRRSGHRASAVQETGLRAVVGHVYEATNAAGETPSPSSTATGTAPCTRPGRVATGGLGAGASLHSQGGVARDGRILFVVNAGDDSVSALASTGHGLVLRDRISTGGDFPVSVTVRDGVGYVLNQGNDTIRGFRYDAERAPAAACPAPPGPHPQSGRWHDRRGAGLLHP